MTTAIGTTYDCKQHGCTNEATSPVGRYSYCREHQGTRPAKAPAVAATGFEARIKELTRLGKEADRQAARAKRLTEHALGAKREADAAAEAFREAARGLGQ